jgi:Domain of unknown function (DUF5658)
MQMFLDECPSSVQLGGATTMDRKYGLLDFVSDEQQVRLRPSSSSIALSPLSLISEKSKIQSLAICLVAISLIDLLVTYVLLNSSSEVYEANPVAQWFFQRWNIFGMTIFKFTLVAVVLVISEIIERRRPGLGRLVLIFACVAAGAVVYQGMAIFTGLANIG